MSLDLIAQFEMKIRDAKRQDRANYFLVEVANVKRNRNDDRAVLIEGRRLDNDQPIVMTTRKSSDGQHLPRPGSVMRADKATRLPTNMPNGAAKYTAEYFHAYGKEDLCIQGVMRASNPFTRQAKTSATVQVLNLESNGGFVTKPQQLEAELLAALKPWAAEQSVLSHDVQGKPIWSENGALGIQPLVLVRMMGGDNVVPFYGLGAVDQRQNEDDAPNPRMPTDEEILAHVRKNPQYQNIVEMAKHPEFAKYGFALIPGVQFNVGRSCLGGGKENYLRAPDSWDWELRDNLPEGGQPKKIRGWREGYIHVKQSDLGRHIVVDAAPNFAYRLTPGVSKTKLEQDVLAARAGAANGMNTQQGESQSAASRAEAPHAAAPKQKPSARPQHVAAQAQTPRSEQAAPQAQAKSPRTQQASPQEPAPHLMDQPPLDAYDQFDDADLEQFADDFAAMESMAAEPAPGYMDGDDTDDLLQEAAKRHADRRLSNLPRM